MATYWPGVNRRQVTWGRLGNGPNYPGFEFGTPALFGAKKSVSWNVGDWPLLGSWNFPNKSSFEHGFPLSRLTEITCWEHPIPVRTLTLTSGDGKVGTHLQLCWERFGSMGRLAFYQVMIAYLRK